MPPFILTITLWDRLSCHSVTGSRSPTVLSDGWDSPCCICCIWVQSYVQWQYSFQLGAILWTFNLHAFPSAPWPWGCHHQNGCGDFLPTFLFSPFWCVIAPYHYGVIHTSYWLPATFLVCQFHSSLRTNCIIPGISYCISSLYTVCSFHCQFATLFQSSIKRFWFYLWNSDASALQI